MMTKALYTLLICTICALQAADDRTSIQDLINHNEIPAFTEDYNDQVLDLSNRSIYRLNGLLNIPGIQETNVLNLNGNNITQLPSGLFNQLPQLRYIYLAHNQIASIKGAFNQSGIEGFDLSHNQLTKLERDSFNKEMRDEHFYIFDFSHNKISEIEKDIFKGIHLGFGGEINLSHNKIKDIYPIFNGLTSAGETTIDVSHNHVKFEKNASNPFNKNLHMEVLNLSHNEIDNDTIIYLLLQRAKKNYTPMTYVSHNKIKHIHSDTIKKLKNLGLHEDDMEFDIARNKLSPHATKRIENTINAIKKGLKDKGADLNFICRPQQVLYTQAASSSASMHDDEITNSNQLTNLSEQLTDRLFL